MDGAGHSGRYVRVIAFTLTAVALAAAAHEIGGGQVSAGWAAAAAVGVLVLVNPILGRGRSPAVQLPLMAALQAGLHWVFMGAHTSGCMPGAAGGLLTAAGHQDGPHERLRPVALSAVQACPSVSSEHGSVLLSPMTLAHGVAAVLLVLLLARGDRAVSSLLSLLRLRVPAMPEPPAPVVLVGRVRKATAQVWWPRQLLQARATRWRGPPSAGLLLSCVTGRSLLG